MKIIHVTQHLGIGGLEKIIFHIIIEQMRLGHEVSIYVYDHDREWVEYFKDNGIKVITPKVKSPGYDLNLLSAMNNDLLSYDIIHSHDMNPLMYLFPIYLLRKIFLLKSPKLIHTTHGLGHIDRHKHYKYIEQLITPIADKIIGVSQKVSSFYLTELWFGKNKIKTIENGIKTYDGPISSELKLNKRSWLAKKHHLDTKLPIVLSLSRIVPLKDQKFLIECFKEKPHYQLLIAGPPSDPNYYDELQKSLPANVQMIGAQDQVSDYNMGADLYVSASTHEGIPVAVLEAIAVETPCLVSKIEGHLTLNKNSEMVSIFELNNKIQFLNLCDLLLSNKDQEKVQRARKIVEKEYSVKVMVEKYMLEYK